MVSRRLLVLVAFATSASCARTQSQAPESLVGAWGDDDSVFQFFDNGTCVLLARKFNVSARFRTEPGRLILEDAHMQYDAPGFLSLPSSQVTLSMQRDYELRLSGGFLPETVHLTEMSVDQAKRKIGEISAAHREAVRKAARAKPKPPQTASPK